MELSTSEKLQHATIRIKVETRSHGVATGTGFFFNFHYGIANSYPVIVTNKHVIEDGGSAVLYFTQTNQEGAPAYGDCFIITINDIDKKFIPHPDNKIDLAVLPVSIIESEAEKIGKNPFYTNIPSSLVPSNENEEGFSAIEDIIMIGYPEGIWDEKNNLPIIRKGITATHPARNYNRKDEFLIDAACFHGSSGSPVFIFGSPYFVEKNPVLFRGRHTYSRVFLLGILQGGPMRSAKGEIIFSCVDTQRPPISSTEMPINLGYVIKSRKLFDFKHLLGIAY